MTDFPAASYITDSSRTEGEVRAALEDWLAATKELLGGDVETALTIATGSITPTTGWHVIDTEAAAATDDLTTIAQTNIPDGRLLVIHITNSSRVVVVKHNATGTGEILLADGADLTLNSTESYLLLRRVGTVWREVRTYKATATQSGVVELATSAEVFTGSDTGRALTPAGLAAVHGIPSVNAQTGTTYLVDKSDRGKLITLKNNSAIAVTLPQATGDFAAPWETEIQNIGAGTVTITPTTSTIDNGQTTLVLTTGQGAKLRAAGDGNYYTNRGGAERTSAPKIIFKAIAYTVLVGDIGGKVIFTTAGVTCGLPAAASAGSQFTITIKNAATSGDITLDPNSSELLDGQTTRLLRPGDCVTLACNGSTWYTVEGEYTYTSADTTIVQGSLMTWTHGLGGVPYSVQLYAVCTTAEFGYSIGDVLQVSSNSDSDSGSGGQNWGGQLSWNNTNVWYTMQNHTSVLISRNKSNFGLTVLTYANWKLRVVAKSK